MEFRKLGVVLALGAVGLGLAGCGEDFGVDDAGRQHISKAPAWARDYTGYQNEYANAYTEWRKEPWVTDFLTVSDKHLVDLLYAGESGWKALEKQWKKDLKPYEADVMAAILDPKVSGGEEWDVGNGLNKWGFVPNYTYSLDWKSERTKNDAVRGEKTLNWFARTGAKPACDVSWSFYEPFPARKGMHIADYSYASVHIKKYWRNGMGRKQIDSLIVPSETKILGIRYGVALPDSARRGSLKHMESLFVDMVYLNGDDGWKLFDVNYIARPQSGYRYGCELDAVSKSYSVVPNMGEISSRGGTQRVLEGKWLDGPYSRMSLPIDPDSIMPLTFTPTVKSIDAKFYRPMARHETKWYTDGDNHTPHEPLNHFYSKALFVK